MQKGSNGTSYYRNRVFYYKKYIFKNIQKSGFFIYINSLFIHPHVISCKLIAQLNQFEFVYNYRKRLL